MSDSFTDLRHSIRVEHDRLQARTQRCEEVENMQCTADNFAVAVGGFSVQYRGCVNHPPPSLHPRQPNRY